MELNTISGLAIAGVICSVVLSMGVPIALFIAGRVKLKARISSFFIGAGTYLLFAMLLEQLLHVLVIQFCGLNAQSRPWLYYVYAALAAAVFEETGRLIAMKFWMKKWLDFPNALMYGIGHGGVEAILLGGLSGISNLVSMLMINSGAMQNTLAALPAESANQTVSQLSAPMDNTGTTLFFVSGIERISAIILHIGLSLLIYRAVKAGKCRTAAFTAVLAYGIRHVSTSYRPVLLFGSQFCKAAANLECTETVNIITGIFFLFMCQNIGTLSHLKFKYNIKFFLCHVIVPPLFCNSYRSRSLVFDLTGSGICI